MVTNNIFNAYIIPYAMLPVIIRVFLDHGQPFSPQVVTTLICSICLRYPHEFIPLQPNGRFGCDFQFERIIATLAVVPQWLSW